MLIVKREISIGVELWAVFTAVGAASTLAEIAIARARPPSIREGGYELARALHGPFRTWRPCLSMSAFEGRADFGLEPTDVAV